jgi:hypothetical protein
VYGVGLCCQLRKHVIVVTSAKELQQLAHTVQQAARDASVSLSYYIDVVPPLSILRVHRPLDTANRISLACSAVQLNNLLTPRSVYDMLGQRSARWQTCGSTSRVAGGAQQRSVVSFTLAYVFGTS